MFAKYIQINYGTATPKLLTFLCVTHNFSWLLSQKMWQPVTLKVGFLPYTKGQYMITEPDPLPNPPHTFACSTPLGVRGPSSTRYQSHSFRLCAVVSPCCVQHILPLQSLTSLGPVGSRHVVHSQAYQALQMISSNIHRDAGCKSYT